MQSKSELMQMLLVNRPDASNEELNAWVNALVQLKGCHVHSLAAQGIDDEGWHAARAKGIGGSEVAAILGKSSWSSPTDIYLKKIPQFESLPQDIQSEAARWGNVLEDVIIKEWSQRTGRRYLHIPVSLMSDENEIFIANIDGFELDDEGTVIGLIECKTTTLHNIDVWRNAEIPVYYMYQIQWYMSITGVQNTCIMCLVGGQSLFYYDFPAIEAIAEESKAGVLDFWNNHVIPCIPPELTDVDAERLQEAKAEQTEETLPVITEDEETIQILENYVELRTQISALEKLKKVTYAQLLEKLGTANEMIAGERQVKCTTSSRRVVDMDLLENKYPEIYEEVVSISKSVRVNVK